MAKQQKAPPGGGGAFWEIDHAGAAINFQDTPSPTKLQAARIKQRFGLAGWRVDARLLVAAIWREARP